jgi:hypothetical protein
MAFVRSAKCRSLIASDKRKQVRACRWRYNANVIGGPLPAATSLERNLSDAAAEHDGLFFDALVRKHATLGVA